MKKLPISTSSFGPLIKEDCIYVDKTEHIYNLFKNNEKYYFLARPRRFGKSLLISTLRELFLGNKELFKTFKIISTDWQWQEHPVIHLDFSIIPHKTVEELERSLSNELDSIAEKYHIDLSDYVDSAEKLKFLIRDLSNLQQVVVLIDEYDKPILDHIHNIEEASKQRRALNSFYGILKGLDQYLRAIFITGVTKFAKTSIFSGLNNLTDLTLDPRAGEILGYTHDELKHNFAAYISSVAQEMEKTESALLEEIALWYDGYQFSKKEVLVYNPFSILHFLNRKEFLNFWFESGTPTFLTELLKARKESLQNIENKAYTIIGLGTFEIESIELPTLLYQTGYLTIAHYDQNYNVFRLKVPNEEVKQSMALLEISAMSRSSKLEIEDMIYKIKYALDHKDVKSFCNVIQALFASIPYDHHIPQEAYYHSLLQMICNLLGINIQTEVHTSVGRIDLTLMTHQYIYIMEFKFNKSAQEALNQIIEKNYAQKFKASSKEIMLIGISFNYKDKQLNLEWITQDAKFE